MVDKGIDGAVELVAALDEWSDDSEIAASAPRSRLIYRYLAEGMNAQLGLGAPPPDDFQAFTAKLLGHLSIWWSTDAYTQLPVMTPWCVRDRSCRYDQGPESWGAPREDGFLRDDNSIIKKLPLPVLVKAPDGHPYNGRKPWRGFTACHIWRELPGGAIAGEDPWLYSFMPNLVWMPTWIAALSDRHESHVQGLLKRTSYARFRDISPMPSVASYAYHGWKHLPAPVSGPALAPEVINEFRADDRFIKRRIAYLDRFITGCEQVVRCGALDKKLICTRYTVGLPLLEESAVASFAEEMRAYRDAAQMATA